jgi:MoaA/NifB/PqqE/SkfB family radical SAM enzyme
MAKELDVKISYQCNNACVFCLNKEKRDHEIDFEFIKKIVEDFGKKGGEKLIISGGGPLISRNFFDLLILGKQKGIKSFEIQTNGRMLYYEEIVRKLKDFQNIGLLVSFHFPTDKLYRKYCQSDGFNQTIEGLKNLIKYNFNFTINTVVMRQNLFYLEEILKVLKKIGINEKIQYRFIDGKNVIDSYDEFVPQYSECAPFVEKAVEKNKDVGIKLNEFPFCVLKRETRYRADISINPGRRNLSSRGKILSTKEILDMQFVYPNCKNCLYKSKCLGVRKEYVDIYGTKEFNPIIN